MGQIVTLLFLAQNKSKYLLGTMTQSATVLCVSKRDYIRILYFLGHTNR